MGMYIEKREMSRLEYRLKQVTEKAIKGGSDEMRKAVAEAQDLAILMAPVKHGTLEQSIEKIEERGDNRRLEVVLKVNEDDVGPTGVRVSEYATRMETGNPAYNLGPKSQRKNESTLTELGAFGALGGLKAGADSTGAGGKAVGPRFMQRAINIVASRLARRIGQRMRAAIRNAK